MYLWQRLASPSWWAINEEKVRGEGRKDLAIIERPGRKSLLLEISCRTRPRANRLRRRFGGSITKLRRDWLKRFTRAQETKPLNIGKRLVIRNVGGTSLGAVASAKETASRLEHQTSSSRRRGPARIAYAKRCGRGRSHIIIPAGAAFGTGQHSTTAMSLRLLEQLSRSWKPGWSMVDLGTGTGILALAAKRFGAHRVFAIDIDPVAISTAKGNARLNRIVGVRFQVGNVTKWRLPARVNVAAANLFSDLLIDVLPKLRRLPWLILSGVMRDQERDVKHALKRNRIHVVKTRRRGKWIALLAKTE